MFCNSTITDLFLFVFTQLILHYPIISNCGKVVIIDNNVVESTSFEESYPGTFFELIIDVSNEHLYDIEEEEEFEW